MFEVRQTSTYAAWFAGLSDRVAKARIDIRIRRLSLGNPGDVKPVGDGISEPVNESGAPEQAPAGGLIKAQSTAVAWATASICNAEQAPGWGMSGCAGFVHRL